MSKTKTTSEVAGDFRSHSGNGTAPISKSATSPVFPSAKSAHGANANRRKLGTKPLQFDAAANRGAVPSKHPSAVVSAARV